MTALPPLASGDASAMTQSPQDAMLRHHGDADIAPGLVDLAVNVRAGMPPNWLRQRLAAALNDLAAYPDARPATEAIAARHRRPPAEVLATSGGAEAFTLIARAFQPEAAIRRAVVVHPQFTEPEVALTAAGHQVGQVLLDAATGFTLDPADVPDDADLVAVGNPTNPTSVLHPSSALESLARPGRLLVVDEAFMDAVPGEPESLATRPDLPGLIVVRSLTKTWGLAGLRAGYILAAKPIIERLRLVQPPWSVSNLAAVAMRACVEPAAIAEAERLAAADEPVRAWVAEELRRLGGQVVPKAQAPFVLVRFPGDDTLRPRLRDAGRAVRRGDTLRLRLRDAGWAVRRGDTFPGLGADWMRIAIRDRPTMARFLTALGHLISAFSPDRP